MGVAAGGCLHALYVCMEIDVKGWGGDGLVFACAQVNYPSLSTPVHFHAVLLLHRQYRGQLPSRAVRGKKDRVRNAASSNCV